MKALLLTVVILCGAIGSVVAQKKNTIMGDLVIGELTAKDENTREITVKYPGKEGTEIFTGILADGHKLRLGEGSIRDVKLSEIALGTHVRIFYKTAKVSGQKINKISRLQVLGNDQNFRVRRQLNLDPSTAVADAETDDWPVTSPLKVYLSIPFKHVHDDLAEWIGKWNRKNGDKYGKLESVSGLEQADILIVVARGADTSVVALPMEGYYGSRVIKGVFTHATSYLVVKDAGQLKVLWTTVAPVLTTADVDVSLKTTESVIAEMEKRMKAKAPGPTK